MAKQMSVFNSAKKGVANQDLPARPWAQQVDNFQDLKFNFGIQTRVSIQGVKSLWGDLVVFPRLGTGDTDS